jgi:hypothetical protein
MLQIRMDSANVFNHPVPLEHRLVIIVAERFSKSAIGGG